MSKKDKIVMIIIGILLAVLYIIGGWIPIVVSIGSFILITGWIAFIRWYYD
jgi:hypothetical protein